MEADAPADAGAGRSDTLGFTPRRSMPQQDAAVCAATAVKADPEAENPLPRASSEQTESDMGARGVADEGEPGGGDEEEEDEEQEVASGPGDAAPAEVRCALLL